MSNVTIPKNRMYRLMLHLAGALVVVVLLGAFYTFAYSPLDHAQRAARDRVVQLQSLLNHVGTEASEYRQLRGQLDQMRTTVAEMHTEGSSYEHQQATIAVMQDLAQQVGLEVLEYQTGPTETFPSYSQAEIDLECKGSYASICRFLDRAENIAKTTKLISLELQPEDNSGVYPVQMTFALYFMGNSHDRKEK